MLLYSFFSPMFFLFLLFAAPVPVEMSATETATPEMKSSDIGFLLNASSDLQGAEGLVSCLRTRFAVRIENPHTANVADYLSRFYGYTDAFHKARRCDSFLVCRQAAMPDNYYHMAVFTYDDNTQVERIRKMEPKGDDNLRTPPTAEAPGRLTFKGPQEYYRVFFLNKRIVFFFWEGRLSFAEKGTQPYPEDSELFATAVKALEDCPEK